MCDKATEADFYRGLDASIVLDGQMIERRVEGLDKKYGPVKAYDVIKGEGRAWISAIDDSKPGDYLPVFEAITLNMMAYLNADLTAIKNFYDAISDKPIDPKIIDPMFAIPCPISSQFGLCLPPVTLSAITAESSDSIPARSAMVIASGSTSRVRAKSK